MTAAAIIATELGRGLDAMRELSSEGGWACAMRYAPKQLQPALDIGFIERRDRTLKNAKYPSFRFEYRLTPKGRDFLAALDKPPAVVVKPAACGKTTVPVIRVPASSGSRSDERRIPRGTSLVSRITESGLIVLEIKSSNGRVLSDVLLDQEERASLIASLELVGDEADNVIHQARGASRKWA